MPSTVAPRNRINTILILLRALIAERANTPVPLRPFSISLTFQGRLTGQLRPIAVIFLQEQVDDGGTPRQKTEECCQMHC